jgi:hypothetical protein
MRRFQNYFVSGDNTAGMWDVVYLDQENEFVVITSLTGPSSALSALILCREMNKMLKDDYDGWTGRLMEQLDIYKEQKKELGMMDNAFHEDVLLECLHDGEWLYAGYIDATFSEILDTQQYWEYIVGLPTRIVWEK